MNMSVQGCPTSEQLEASRHRSIYHVGCTPLGHESLMNHESSMNLPCCTTVPHSLPTCGLVMSWRHPSSMDAWVIPVAPPPPRHLVQPPDPSEPSAALPNEALPGVETGSRSWRKEEEPIWQQQKAKWELCPDQEPRGHSLTLQELHGNWLALC